MIKKNVKKIKKLLVVSNALSLYFFSILKQRRKCDQNGGLKSNYNIRY
jgi:hypothetical protein